MPAYVTLPGTSGNYFSTPDVNLLDADTAHLHQSIGSWTEELRLVAPAVLTSSPNGLSPVVGGSALEIETNTANTLAQIGQANEQVAVSAATQYTFSYYMMSATASRETNVSIVEYDSGGSQVANPFNSAEALSVDEWGQHTHTWTTHASAASIAVDIRYRTAGGFASGEKAWIDAVCLRTGSDGTFVPSLRIVGDLDIEAKVALDDYTPTATNTILDCLNSNDGYRLRHTTGDLIEIAYGNGSSTRAQSSSATGLVDGSVHVIKVTVDQSTGAVVYYIDGVQHDTGTMTTGAGAPDINDLVVGANAAASANWTDGDIYYVIVRDGIDGPVVARFDADDWVGV